MSATNQEHRRLTAGNIGAVSNGYPSRIVCLSTETTEIIYLLGEQDRIAGISGYTTRPREARLKPKVSAFSTAKIDKILDLQPDLVLAFSDLQANIVRELIVRGLPVMTFNQRSVAEILQTVLMIGRMLGCERKAHALVDSLVENLEEIEISAARLAWRPKVFFEEWKDPLISGIRWVEELIEIAGGEPVFPELRMSQAAKDRIVTTEAVCEKNPDMIFASWCGVKVDKGVIGSRKGWENIAAVKNGHVYEIKSAHILQPGAVALTEGVQQIHEAVKQVCGAMR